MVFFISHREDKNFFSLLGASCLGKSQQTWKLFLKEREEHSSCREETQKFSQFSSVAQSCPTLWDPMNRSMPGLEISVTQKSNRSLSKKKINNQHTRGGTALLRTGMGLPTSQNSTETHRPLKNLGAEGKVMANRCYKSVVVKIKRENYAKDAEQLMQGT